MTDHGGAAASASEAISTEARGNAVSPNDAQRLYAERAQRIADVIALREPDRVPTAYSSQFWHTTHNGISCKQAMYDYEALARAIKSTVIELQPDVVSHGYGSTAIGPVLEMIGYRALAWPGHGVADDRPYQYLDKEYMTAAEYDEFIEDPNWFVFTKFLPRISEACAPLAKLPEFAGHTSMRLASLVRAFGDPEVAACFDRLRQAGEEGLRAREHGLALERELNSLGFPIERGSHCSCPYDYFADYYRGSRGIMLDLFRHRQKLLDAMDKVVPLLVRAAVAGSVNQTSKIVFMAMHWGLDGFMSLEQFKTFFWGPLRRVILGLIEHGLTPLVFWEGDCQSRLETIADIPAGKCIYYFERTDLFRAKAVLGDVVCLRGNVPASMLIAGTPEEVTTCCRKLIEKVGKGGGFILSGGTGVPDEAKPENVIALFEAVHKFGHYR